MTDIVERLRSPEFADVAAKYLMAEAAEEIERLRDEIHGLKQHLATAHALHRVRNEALEEAAKVADERASGGEWGTWQAQEGQIIATAIRALKEKTPEP